MKRSYGSAFGRRKNVVTSVSQVKKIVDRQLELKYKDAVLTSTAVSNTMSISATPFDVAQGVGTSQRVGGSLNWCGHIDFRFQIVNSTGAPSDTYNNFRIVIVQWFPAVSVPTAADLFIVGPTGTYDHLSQFNHDRRKEYLVLFDKCFHTSGNGASASSPPSYNHVTGGLYFRISLANARKNSKFVGATTAGTNKLYLCLVSDSAIANHPTIIYSTKVVFRDG